MNSIWTGAIIGGVIGLLVVVFTHFSKEQKFNKLLKTLSDPGVEYTALYHYASFKRYKSSFKFFDNYGIFYVIGKMAYYKAGENQQPFSFDLNECSVQAEPDWRWLKWFSITTPAGEKFYFNSHKMGAFKNNSDETLKGLAVLQAKSKA